jgi:hypothetical protein
MTDWEIKLNNEIDRVKNNPEEIKKLIKEYIKEIGELTLERFFNLQYAKSATNAKHFLTDIIEYEFMERNIENYNTDLFYQY